MGDGLGHVLVRGRSGLKGWFGGYEALNLDERTPALFGLCYRESIGVQYTPFLSSPRSPKQTFNTLPSTISTHTHFLAVVIKPSPLLQTEAHERDERG